MTLLRTVDLTVACEAPPPDVRLPTCPEVDKLKVVLFLSIMTGSSEGGRHKSRSVVRYSSISILYSIRGSAYDWYILYEVMGFRPLDPWKKPRDSLISGGWAAHGLVVGAVPYAVVLEVS